MNRLLIFSFLILFIASCKKESQREKINYDSLISYRTYSYSICACDTGAINFTFYIPTGFTPNGDFINEFWFPKSCGLDSSDYHISIFDKTGKIVFEASSPVQWDGKGKNGYIMAMQTFGYYIKAKSKHGEHYEYKGKFTLYL